jgi:hypothetical protein
MLRGMFGAVSDLEARRRTTLRGLSLVSGGLAAAIAVLGFVPGYRVESEGRLPDLIPVSTAPLGLCAVMAILAALALVVWRRPLIGHALLVSLVSIGVSVFLLGLTAAPLAWPGVEVTLLPAALAVNRLVLALVVVQIALVPLACVIHTVAAYARRRDQLAPARVHRRGRT